MTKLQALRSTIAYMNHFGPMHECKHGHMDCAIRHNGPCLDERMSLYPEFNDMTIGELVDVLHEMSPTTCTCSRCVRYRALQAATPQAPAIENRTHTVRGFNTGRLYGPRGQEISWQVVEKLGPHHLYGLSQCYSVLMNDHTRMIFGVVTVVCMDGSRPVDHCDVLRAYDNAGVRYDARADKVRAESFTRI